MQLETLAIHAGHEADPATGAVMTPTFDLSTTFERRPPMAKLSGRLCLHAHGQPEPLCAGDLSDGARRRRGCGGLRLRHGGDCGHLPGARSGITSFFPTMPILARGGCCANLWRRAAARRQRG